MKAVWLTIIVAYSAADGGGVNPVSALVALLARSNDPALQEDVLSGMIVGFEGRRSVPMPENWPDAYRKLLKTSRSQLREKALAVALIFDDPTALQSLRRQAANRSESARNRNRALQLLIAKRDADLADMLINLIEDRPTQRVALQGLAEYNHPQTIQSVLSLYPSLDPPARADAVNTLASRPRWARALLDAVDDMTIPSSDLSAFAVRQLRSLGDKELVKRVRKLWGNVRETPADKRRKIDRLKERLTNAPHADLAAGRVLFQKTCANCHRLFDAGEKVGPDLTGSQRHNLDYILENIIDPSATVSKDYQMQVFETSSGRVITGLVLSESENAVTIKTATEKIVVPADEIEQRAQSQLSLMPDGMLDKMTHTDILNLIGYLASPRQVPLKEQNSSDGSQEGSKRKSN